MAKGRKRKPMHLHVIEGTVRKSRVAENAPEPASDLPVAPVSLTDDELRHFERVVAILDEQGIASRSHVDTVTLIAIRLAEIDLFSAKINYEGASYETFTNGGGRMVRMRPEIAARSESMRHLHALLAEMGLTLASLSKVNKPKGVKPSNPFSALG